METGGRTLFVHVGLPRTGTTSIQMMLHQYSPQLARVGVHVLRVGARAGKHWDLVWPSVGASRAQTWVRANLWNAAREEIARSAASRIVVSAENFTLPRFSHTSARWFSALAEDAKVDIRIIGVVRPQWQIVEAHWSQTLVDGESLPDFKDWLPGFLSSTHLDYAECFRPWREQFGDVRIIPLQPSQFTRGLLVHFLQAVGVDDEQLFSSVQTLPHAHARPGAKKVEVLRVTSAALASVGLADWERRRVVQYLLAGSKGLLSSDSPFAGLSSEQVRQIANHFELRNRSFANAYGVGVDGELFPNPSEDSYARPNVACWEDFDPVERQAVRTFVRERIGLQLPDRLRTLPVDYRTSERARRDALRRLYDTLPWRILPRPRGTTARRCVRWMVLVRRGARLYCRVASLRLVIWWWQCRRRANPS